MAYLREQHGSDFHLFEVSFGLGARKRARNGTHSFVVPLPWLFSTQRVNCRSSDAVS